MGYGHARGFAMSHGVCREAFGNSSTAGTGTGAGMGLDFGTDYVHGWTKLRCEVDCATLDWDDIPLLDSKAGCKQ